MRSSARYLLCFFDGVKYRSVSPPGNFDVESIRLLLLRCALQTSNSVGKDILDQLALLYLFVKIIDSVPFASHKTTVHYQRFLSDSRHSELVSSSVANSMNVEPRLGLRRLPVLRLLKEGEIFIIRYKNAMRNYTTDVWIGVVLPHMFGPTRHTHRRPSGAKPEDGEWTTHLKDRVYSFYLPGRNM
ncbi:hypothetical protein N7452_010409 [Penicillium brevicompactum]|uniref:Uncharacterized protein n=1 Tax=Penicillium brevicompactum TaxID=5074 RepID=A0A9W9UC55_PENBR|nr:hypothetical protein N7452_010409 [Penicillium brevicompactum]